MGGKEEDPLCQVLKTHEEKKGRQEESMKKQKALAGHGGVVKKRHAQPKAKKRVKSLFFVHTSSGSRWPLRSQAARLVGAS